MKQDRKYYAICEHLDDKIQYTALAVRLVGCHQKPAYIKQEMEELRVDKFEKELDYLYELDAKALLVVKSYIATVIKISRKYHFNPANELPIGCILEGYKYPRKEKVIVDKNKKQSSFDFGG